MWACQLNESLKHLCITPFLWKLAWWSYLHIVKSHASNKNADESSLFSTIIRWVMIFVQLFCDNYWEKNDIYRKIKGENKNKCENEGELSKNYYKIIVQILFLISSFAISIWYTILLSISPKNGNPCNIVVSCSKAWKTPIDI